MSVQLITRYIVATRRPLELAYFFSIACAVIPFASVYPVALCLSCFLFGTIAITVCFYAVVNIKIRMVIGIITVCAGVTVAWSLFQTVGWIGNPMANPVWRLVSVGGEEIPGAISVNPGETLVGLLALLAPCLAAISGLRLFSDDGAALRLWVFLSSFGMALVFATLLQYIIFPGTILVFDKWAYTQEFTVTFINRNTAATFIGVVLLLNIGLLLLRVRDFGSDRMWRRIKIFDFRKDKEIGWIILRAIFCFLLVVGLSLTKSRAGFAFSLLSIILLMYLVHGPSIAGSAKNLKRYLVYFVFPGVAVTCLFWGLGGVMLDRVAEVGVQDSARLCTYKSVLNAIRDHFWYGTGFGTFVDVFPGYRDPSCSGVVGIWDRAHNSYLEFILGVGVIGIVILAIVCWILVATFVTGLKARFRMRFAPATALSIFVLTALHSLVDFPVQIPGFAIFVSAAFAGGLVMSCGDGVIRRGSRHQSVRRASSAFRGGSSN